VTAAPRWKPVAVAALWAIAVAALGALTTDIGPWYAQLHKPSWQPPDWLFGPAWTLIFALAALAGVLYWRSTTRRDDRLWILIAFAMNGFLNALWSLLFFRIRRPDFALEEVGFLWISILLLILLAMRRSSTAAWLLVPYLLWVSFASYLNWTILRLNGSFVASG
jgi:benzodiazapine receptor